MVVPTPHNRESKANGELKLNRNYGAAGAMQGCTLRGFDVLGVGVWVGWACRFGVSDLRNLQGLPDSSLELYTGYTQARVPSCCRQPGSQFQEPPKAVKHVVASMDRGTPR